MVVGGATDVVGIVRRLHPATAVTQELEFELIGGTEDVLEGDAQLETFGTGDADWI